MILSTVLSAKNNQGKHYNLYIDESGNIGIKEPFVIGALLIDSSYNYRKITLLRTTTKFKLVLRYKSSNKFKLNFAIPLISEFFHEHKMSYSALIFPTSLNQTWESEKKIRSVIYHHNYNSLIKQLVKRNVHINLYLEKRSTTAEDLYLKLFLEKKFENIKIFFIKKKNNDLLQLTDVLTGSIYGDIRNTKDKTKQKIIHTLKTYLKVKNLYFNSTSLQNKFNVKMKTTL